MISILCTAGVATSDQAGVDSIRRYAARIGAEANNRSRAILFYTLVEGISERRIRITSASEATELAKLMTDVLERDPDSVLRWQAAAFLAEHSHPVAAEALLRAASNRERSNTPARDRALDALVSLHDRRVLPELLWDMARPGRSLSPAAFRRLAELGDPAGLAPLRSFAADTLNPSAQRDAARRAERDLRLLIGSRLVNNFELSDAALETIQKDGFTIMAATKNEMFELYGAEYPFITSDVMWHTFMILLRASLNELERLILAPDLAEFSAQMVRGSMEQRNRISDPHLRSLAQQNAAIFAVASTLLSGPDSLRAISELQPAVELEVARIRSHEGIATSSLFGYDEDFTKYELRGRHNKDLAGYYQAMMYLGRMSWRPHSRHQTQQAMLILDVLEREPGTRRLWARTDSVLTLLFGENDDLTVTDYERICDTLAPARGTSRGRYVELAGYARFLQVLSDSLTAHRPRIRTATPSSPTGPASVAAGVGLRIFGQRYTRPIHQLQLVMETGVWPPSGLDVVSRLLGSDRALAIVGRRPESTRVGSAANEDASRYRSLSEGWIHASRSLFQPPEGVPDFMRREPWEEKQINTALGAWAELQHATSLYTKDANHYKSASGVLDRFHGYVEPIPEFYMRVHGVVHHLTSVLDRVELFRRIQRDRDAELRRLGPALSPRGASEQGREGWRRELERDEAAIRLERSLFDEFSAMLRRLASIASKEVRGEAQTIDDGYFLKGLARRLMYLSFNRSGTNTSRTPMALVTDVATEYQSRSCLEIAVGKPFTIYVAIPDGGNTFICKGAVYSYYEFLRPITDRVDDETWKSMSVRPVNEDPPPWLGTRGRLDTSEYPPSVGSRP